MPKRRKPNANDRIRAAMRKNEQMVQWLIRRSMQMYGRGWAPFLAGNSLWNALDRLVAAKLVKHSRRYDGYVLIDSKGRITK